MKNTRYNYSNFEKPVKLESLFPEKALKKNSKLQKTMKVALRYDDIWTHFCKECSFYRIYGYHFQPIKTELLKLKSYAMELFWKKITPGVENIGNPGGSL